MEHVRCADTVGVPTEGVDRRFDDGHEPVVFGDAQACPDRGLRFRLSRERGLVGDGVAGEVGRLTRGQPDLEMSAEVADDGEADRDEHDAGMAQLTRPEGQVTRNDSA
jgi:hypothetical protein